ncbi:MAG: hypothetical protein FJW31_22185 [Acidobacteria bacterium]|nr:hypothetical protein [Acidobacteriota bacterium]MBM4230397.1 hypothetical protein [Gammaproteobacteria bacterium]
MLQTVTPYFLRMCRSVDALRRLVLMLVLAALAPAAPSSISTPAAAKRSYDIPAGDATVTLQRYVEQSGEQILYVVPTVRGVKTNAVSAKCTAREAIERMVAKTVLIVVEDPQTGAVMIQRSTPSRAPPEAPSAPPPETPKTAQPQTKEPSPKSNMKNTKLVAWLLAILGSASAPSVPAQTVNDDSKRVPSVPAQTVNDDSKRGDEVVTLSPFTISSSADTGYGAQSGTSGRLAAAYIDTPQASSIVTSELLKVANLFGSNEALKYVPGVRNTSMINGTQNIRGLSTASSYTDGFVNSATNSFDTFFTDRIEVIKGPSSTAFGRGDPAGFINYISKRPQFRQGGEIGILVGTGNDRQDTYRGTLDYNGFLTADRRTAYRFVSLYTEGAQSNDNSEYRGGGAQLAVTRRFADAKGSVDVIGTLRRSTTPGHAYQAQLSNQHYLDFTNWATLTLNGLRTTPANFEPLDPDYAPGHDLMGMHRIDFRLTAILDYKLSEHWRTRQAASLLSFDLDGNYRANLSGISQAADGTWMHNLRLFAWQQDRKQLSYQSDLLGAYEFDRIGGKLSLLAGADINSMDFVDSTLRTTRTPVIQPLFASNRQVHVGPFLRDPSEIALATTGSNWSAYAQAQIKFLQDKVQLSGAVRRIWQDTRTLNRGSGAVTSIDQHTPLLPAYSLLIKPKEWMSIYVSRSEHTEPVTVASKFLFLPDGDPRLTETLVNQPKTQLDEVGAKATLVGGRLTLSVAHYKVQTAGGLSSFRQLIQNPDGTTVGYNEFYVRSAQVKGWEVEAFGQINRRLTFMLGGNFGTTSSQTVTWLGQKIDAQLGQIGDTAYGYATYTFGQSRSDGLSVTAGWKTYFSGWSMSISGAPRGKGVYPDNLTTVDLGLSYGFKRKYELFINGKNLFHKKSLPLGDQANQSGRQIFAGINARL